MSANPQPKRDFQPLLSSFDFLRIAIAAQGSSAVNPHLVHMAQLAALRNASAFIGI
jgi:hypothetical protein